MWVTDWSSTDPPPTPPPRTTCQVTQHVLTGHKGAQCTTEDHAHARVYTLLFMYTLLHHYRHYHYGIKVLLQTLRLAVCMLSML